MSQSFYDTLSSFEALFRQYYTELCRYALKLTRNEQIAEEVVQEVFINFWERRAEISINHSIKAYLISSVRNRSINYLKLQLPKELRKDDIENIQSPLAYTPAHNTLEYDELKDLIQQAIDRLPKRCRIIFVLSREEGLTYKEIADKLELSQKTVENQMSVALKKLRDSLGPYLKNLGVILLIYNNFFL